MPSINPRNAKGYLALRTSVSDPGAVQKKTPQVLNLNSVFYSINIYTVSCGQSHIIKSIKKNTNSVPYQYQLLVIIFDNIFTFMSDKKYFSRVFILNSENLLEFKIIRLITEKPKSDSLQLKIDCGLL